MALYQEQSAATTIEHERRDNLLLAPYFLVRVAGLPFTSIEQLQFPQTLTIIEELLQIEIWLNEHTETLQEQLRNHCKQIEEKDIQHKVLDMRRAITSQNGQKVQKLLHRVAFCLPEELVAA